MIETVSELRALRASVVSHWRKAHPTTNAQQIEDLVRFHEAIDQAVAGSLEQYATAKEMQTRLFEAILVASPLDEQQNAEATVCISRDITQQAISEEKMWHSAHHDPLTGLPNRRLFLDRLEQEIKHAERSRIRLALLFMDLDGFKEVNDSLGHEA